MIINFNNAPYVTVISYWWSLLLTDQIAIFYFQHSIDCIIHFAALKAVGESCEKPLEYYKNNVIGSINLLEVDSVPCRWLYYNNKQMHY